MARSKTYGPYKYQYKLGSRNYDVQSDIDRIVADTENRMLLVMRESLNNVVEEAQTPVAKGGKMRVDTGFLRISGRAELNKIPAWLGRGRKRKPGESGILPEYAYDESNGPLVVILSRMKFGDTFFFGWTANYAKYREAYDGFLESALQNWQSHVDRAVEKLRKARGMT